MRPARLAVTLHCTTCGGRFTLPGLDGNLTYVCVRCDVPIASPASGTETGTTSSRGGVRYLYPRHSRSGGHSWRRPFGRYTLHDEIGRGGMGVVYRAWDGVLQKFVALKVLLSGEHSTSEQVERFLREARAVSKVDHPNLVKVFDLGWTDDRAYFTMELVDGPTLQDVLEARGALPLNETLRIGAAIARALATAHDSGLVHRDVKPANVLLQVDGTPLLADFGLAADLFEEGGRLTRTGQVLGTPTYMAPEQVTGDHQATPRTDQYGLGAVLFECLAGEPPYTGEEAMAVLQDIVLGPPPSLRERRPTVPKSVALVVETAMARDPLLRYPDARALADDLDRCRRGQPVNANPPSLRYRIEEVVRRNGRLLGLGAVTLASLVVGLQLTTTALGALESRVSARREGRSASELAALQKEVSTLRGAGRQDEAAARLLTFSQDRSVQGTRAEIEALLDRAAMLTEAQSSGALAAWATAYTSAREPDAIERSLLGLASEARASWRWSALGEAAERLAARSPGAQAEPLVQQWRAEALASQGALLDASRVLKGSLPGASRLLEALAPAQAAASLQGRILSADLDGDGAVELWLAEASALSRIDPQRLTVSARYPFPEPVQPSQVHLVQGTGMIVAGVAPEGAPTGVRLYALRDDPPSGGALEQRLAFEDGAVLSAAAADLDDDGQDEIWVGIGPYGRHLLRLAPDRAGRWSVRSPLPQVDAAWSDLTSLAAADLDADGRDELLVTLAAWSAYDVRVIRGSPQGPVVSARRKMGHLSHLVPAGDGSFWVAKSDRSPSRVVFSDAAPYGEPAGLYRLSLGSEGASSLQTGHFVPAPPCSAAPPVVDHVLWEDFDGDGARDLIVSLISEQDSATALVPGGDAQQGVLLIGGLRPLASAQLDADLGQELLVSRGLDGPVYALGLGTGSLPALASAPDEAVQIDPSLPAELRRQWKRVEDLARMGLQDAASAELVRLLDLEDAPGRTSPRAKRRAAELLERGGDDRGAARLYQAAAEETGDPLLRARAAGSHLRGHRFAEALAVLQSDPAAPPSPQIGALAALLAQDRSERLRFDRGLPDAVEVRDPGSVQVDSRAQALRLTVPSDDGDLVAIPLRWTGERLGLEVTLELQRLEWGSGLRFSLRNATDEVELSVSGQGGGAILERGIGCSGTFIEPSLPRLQRASPSDTVSLALSLDLARLTGDVRCSWRVGDEEHHDNLTFPQMPEAGDWELVIGPAGHGAVEGALAIAVIQEITLRGSGLSLRGADPRLAWASQLASGPLVDRRSIVSGELPRGASVWEALALADAGRADEAVQALRQSSLSPETAREVAQGLRSHLASFGPVVQNTWPDRYHELFERAYTVPLAAHPDDELLMRALLTGLPMALDARAPARIGRARAARLLAARGRAWAGTGQPAAARRDLTQATRLGGADTEPRGPASSAWVGLAALAAAEGDEEAALSAVTRALSVSAAPELTADIVRVTPELAPYVSRWAAVLP